MILGYNALEILKVDMIYYATNMLEEFPYELTGSTSTPWNDTLFKLDNNSKKMNEKQNEYCMRM